MVLVGHNNIFMKLFGQGLANCAVVDVRLFVGPKEEEDWRSRWEVIHLREGAFGEPLRTFEPSRVEAAVDLREGFWQAAATREVVEDKGDGTMTSCLAREDAFM